MVLCTPVISTIIWKWSIHYASLSAILKPLHSKTNQELYENHLCNKAATIKNMNEAVRPSSKCHANQLSSEKWSIHYTSLSTIIDLFYTNMNQDLVEKHLYNQGSHYEKYGMISIYDRICEKGSYSLSKSLSLTDYNF